MKDYTLKISTPDGDAFSGSALSLSVRGTEGELGILAGHAPFVTSRPYANAAAVGSLKRTARNTVSAAAAACSALHRAANRPKFPCSQAG